MKREDVCKKLQENQEWQMFEIPETIPHGDMPGDKVEIGAIHIKKANTIFPKLLELLVPLLSEQKQPKAVLTVCGGSGVGKSEIASLLSYFLNEIGVGSYTLSGDNYPHKIPKYNDAERLRVYRKGGQRQMIEEAVYSAERAQIIREFQKEDTDADPAHTQEYPWYEAYLRGGRAALSAYLGTDKEIDFQELQSVIEQFKNGAEQVWLKRMGRGEADLWYDHVDFSNVSILIIEWTHGNSDRYQGVDIPIFLHSTPKETLEHRKSRNRDGAIDSPFTQTVLELEQKMLEQQAHKAKLILSKEGKLLSFDEYCRKNEE